MPVEHDAAEAFLDEEYETDGFLYGKVARSWKAYKVMCEIGVLDKGREILEESDLTPRQITLTY